MKFTYGNHVNETVRKAVDFHKLRKLHQCTSIWFWTIGTAPIQLSHVSRHMVANRWVYL